MKVVKAATESNKSKAIAGDYYDEYRKQAIWQNCLTIEQVMYLYKTMQLLVTLVEDGSYLRMFVPAKEFIRHEISHVLPNETYYRLVYNFSTEASIDKLCRYLEPKGIEDIAWEEEDRKLLYKKLKEEDGESIMYDAEAPVSAYRFNNEGPYHFTVRITPIWACWED